jgi:hypothetical protein
MRKFLIDPVSPEAEANHRELQKTVDYLNDLKEEKDASIQAAIDAQASGEQRSALDDMLNWMGGGSSSSAVRSGGKAAAPKNTATPGKPFAHKVGDVVTDKGKPFTVRSKDFDTPHARVYNGDPNKARQREARLIGA